MLAPGDLLGTAITDDSGKVVFNTPGVGWLKLSKDQYWSGEAGGWLFTSTRLELTPIATLKVRLQKINPNPYPRGYLLNLRAAWDASCACGSEMKQLTQPGDATTYLKGVGNTRNYVSWQLDSDKYLQAGLLHGHSLHQL